MHNMLTVDLFETSSNTNSAISSLERLNAVGLVKVLIVKDAAVLISKRGKNKVHFHYIDGVGNASGQIL